MMQIRVLSGFMCVKMGGLLKKFNTSLPRDKIWRSGAVCWRGALRDGLHAFCLEFCC